MRNYAILSQITEWERTREDESQSTFWKPRDGETRRKKPGGGKNKEEESGFVHFGFIRLLVWDTRQVQHRGSNWTNDWIQIKQMKKMNEEINKCNEPRSQLMQAKRTPLKDGLPQA